MANTLEQVQERYQNISSVEPLMDALRTISLGSWQQAINKRSHLTDYHQELQAILSHLLPAFKALNYKKEDIEKLALQSQMEEESKEKVNLLIVIGSERGLCGNFNGVIAEKATKVLEANSSDLNDEVWAVGSRLDRYLKRYGVNPSRVQRFSASSLPSINDSVTLINEILTNIDRFNQVTILYNNYLSVTKYVPIQQQLIPFHFATDESLDENFIDEPIVDSDLISLIQQVAKQLLVFNLYDVLMKSATAEHATRFSLMEEASQNAERLLAEINQEFQALRRQIITREMIELAAGAGLIKS